RHTRFSRDWSSDVCSSDLAVPPARRGAAGLLGARLAVRGSEGLLLLPQRRPPLSGADGQPDVADGHLPADGREPRQGQAVAGGCVPKCSDRGQGGQGGGCRQRSASATRGGGAVLLFRWGAII